MSRLFRLSFDLLLTVIYLAGVAFVMIIANREHEKWCSANRVYYHVPYPMPVEMYDMGSVCDQAWYGLEQYVIEVRPWP